MKKNPGQHFHLILAAFVLTLGTMGLGSCVSITGSSLELLLPSFSVEDGTASWTLTTSTDFVRDGSYLDWTGSEVRVDTVQHGLTDVSYCGTGTLTNTECFNAGSTFTAVRLSSGNTSGTYLSPIFDAGDDINWTGHDLRAVFPYGLPLADNGGTDSGYGASFGMTNNLALYHADALVGSVMADTSGNGNDATCSGTCPTTTDSLFNGGLDFDGSSYISAPADLVRFDGNTSISLWLNYTSIGGVTTVLDARTSTTDLFQLYQATDGRICASIRTGASPLTRCSGSAISDGLWHHVAVTFEYGTTSSQLSLYVDGAFDNSAAGPILGLASGSSLTLGGRDGGPGSYDGGMDEIAVFDRLLNASQVEALYRRGSLSQEWQVQFCSDNTCSDTFVGPDGTNSTWFTEEDRASGSFTFSGSPSSQYVQFQVNQDRMDTSDPSPVFDNFGWLPSHYFAGYQTIANSDTTSFTEMTGFRAELTSDSTGAPTFQISNDGSAWYYYNGANWVAASGVTDSNSVADVNTNIVTFDDDVGTGDIYFRAVLRSSGGTEIIGLEEVQIDFN